MRSYGPAIWLDYYDTHVIMGAWYYTSCCIQQNCQMHFIALAQVRSEVHSWLHSIVHSQPAWLNLPTDSWGRFQVHCKYAPKYTSEYVLKHTAGHAAMDAHTCTRWHTVSLLDCTLPYQRTRSYQAHSWARSQVCFTLHSMVHSQPTWLYAPKYTLKREDTPNLTWLYAHMYPPACSIWRHAKLQKPGSGRHQLQAQWLNRGARRRRTHQQHCAAPHTTLKRNSWERAVLDRGA